jgi:DNA-binding MarR family transcriptional regulator
MKLSAAAVRASLRLLERKGFLVRVRNDGDTNHYDLTPLFERLKERVNR